MPTPPEQAPAVMGRSRSSSSNILISSSRICRLCSREPCLLCCNNSTTTRPRCILLLLTLLCCGLYLLWHLRLSPSTSVMTWLGTGRGGDDHDSVSVRETEAPPFVNFIDPYKSYLRRMFYSGTLTGAFESSSAGDEEKTRRERLLAGEGRGRYGGVGEGSEQFNLTVFEGKASGEPKNLNACVPLHVSGNRTVRICVYEREVDTMISAALRDQGVWEKEHVEGMVFLLRKDDAELARTTRRGRGHYSRIAWDSQHRQYRNRDMLLSVSRASANLDGEVRKKVINKRGIRSVDGNIKDRNKVGFSRRDDADLQKNIGRQFIYNRGVHFADQNKKEKNKSFLRRDDEDIGGDVINVQQRTNSARARVQQKLLEDEEIAFLFEKNDGDDNDDVNADKTTLDSKSENQPLLSSQMPEIEESESPKLARRKLTLVDVGCNVGVYTLTAASLGHPVVAVDPVISNLQLLHRSLLINGLQHHATLLLHAVSNRPGPVRVHLASYNLGGSSVSHVRRGSSGKVTAGVQAVCLDHIVHVLPTRRVLLKLDIEGWEARALSCASAFFQQLDVRAVFLEWLFLRNRAQAADVIAFLTRNGLLPFADITQAGGVLHPGMYYAWPDNVWWMKR